MDVPFLNLREQYESIKDEVEAAIAGVLEQCSFAGGPAVAAFEADFARYCGARHAIGVGSGTEALWLALLGLGVGPGDEVITAANTFIATAEAISFAGARPVFVDVVEGALTMDPEKLEEAITPKTKAIIPVHLYGQMADMDPIMELARSRGLMVVEDACQAHGAQYKGRMAGSIGDAGCFSFYPGKNLGAYGEAGSVVTDNEALAGGIREILDHGQSEKYHHRRIGWNARMDGIQGAVLGVKLRHLPSWTEARRRHACHYRELLGDCESIALPAEMDEKAHVYHLYVVRVAARDLVMRELAARGVGTGIHYPIPIHLQPAYADLGLEVGAFPVAESAACEIISLPMYPELSNAHLVTAAKALLDLAGRIEPPEALRSIA